MSEPELSDFEDAEDITSGLTLADVDRIRLQLSDKCSTVNAYLLSPREPVDKRRMIENTLQDLLNAFKQMSASYLRVRAVGQTAAHLRSALSDTIKQEVAAALQHALPALATPTTYADAVLPPKSKQIPSLKVRVTNGPTVVVPNTVSVVIGPKSASVAKFASADDTKKAIMKAVKPAEVNLRVNKIVGTRNNAVRIIADSLDVAKLKTCKSLDAAGLEVKERERLNPRLVIRDVPTDLTDADLIADIVALNLDGPSKDEIKIVYRYPSRAKSNTASVVIEANADVRRKFLSKGRICLSWLSCRVEDHLRILQCFKCQNFGHIAKSCSSSAVCGICAGAHESPSCPAGQATPKRNNCVLQKLSNVDHKAFDASKCPIIKRRLTEKAKNIAY